MEVIRVQGSLGAQALESQGLPALVCSLVQVQEWLRVLERVYWAALVQGWLGAVELAAFLWLCPGRVPPPLLVVRLC